MHEPEAHSITPPGVQLPPIGTLPFPLLGGEGGGTDGGLGVVTQLHPPQLDPGPQLQSGPPLPSALHPCLWHDLVPEPPPGQVQAS